MITGIYSTPGFVRIDLPVGDAGLVDADLFGDLPLEQLQHQASAQEMVAQRVQFLRRLVPSTHQSR